MFSAVTFARRCTRPRRTTRTMPSTRPRSAQRRRACCSPRRWPLQTTSRSRGRCCRYRIAPFSAVSARLTRARASIPGGNADRRRAIAWHPEAGQPGRHGRLHHAAAQGQSGGPRNRLRFESFPAGLTPDRLQQQQQTTMLSASPSAAPAESEESPSKANDSLLSNPDAEEDRDYYFSE